MTPILFAENSTVFTSNGIGRLADAISCNVTEQRNGQYELEMSYPETGIHAESISNSKIICVIPYEGATLQPFRIYKITKPIKGIFSIYAQHISYQLSLIPTMPFEIAAASTACNDTLQALKTNAVESCPFTFQTDVTTVASYTQTVPASIRSRLGGVAGSVLDQFGGEFEWDGYTVKLLAHRGVQTPTVTLRYGKNITDLNQEQNIADVITGIVPYWCDSEGGNIVTLPEKSVDSSHASDYPFKRTVVVDFSNDFEEQPTVAQLRTHAQAYVNKAGIGIPKVSIKVSFLHLADTEEYKDIAPLQTVKLCDVVGVVFEKYGINTTAKVIKTVYDVLAERYTSIELGDARSSLASTINDANNSVTELANNTTKNFAKINTEIQTEIDNATAWLTADGGYVIAIKDSDDNWQSILFADSNDPDQWHNVLRINQNGIGFSSDGGQTFTQAWTLDGHLVIGGTNVPSITVYDNSNPRKTIFQADATAMIWNATNSSMDANGVITATGAQLTDAVISNTNGQTSEWVRIQNGALILGRNNQGLLTISSAGIVGDVLIDTTNQGYGFPADVKFGVITEGDILLQGIASDTDIIIDAQRYIDFKINGVSKADVRSNEIQTFDDINIRNNRLYGGSDDRPFVGSEAEVRFADSIDIDGDLYYDNLTLEGDRILLNSDDIYVRGSRDSGNYRKGYTGTISVGGATLVFVNGICV